METDIEIQNLKCGGCESTILKKLKQIEGVKNVSITVETSIIHLAHTADNVLEKVKNTLSHLGYPVVDEANSLSSKAKSYVNCAMGKLNNLYADNLKQS